MNLRRPAVLKWTGASLCALIFVAWFASGYLDCGVDYLRAPDWCEVELCAGRLSIKAIQTITLPGFVPSGWSWACSGRARPSWDWSCDRQRFDNALYALQLPLYIPFTLLAFPTVWFFYCDRRSVRWAEAGRCAGCGYSLSGLPSGAACPECGTGAGV